jgi:hypothetical protein
MGLFKTVLSGQTSKMFINEQVNQLKRFKIKNNKSKHNSRIVYNYKFNLQFTDFALHY